MSTKQEQINAFKKKKEKYDNAATSAEKKAIVESYNKPSTSTSGTSSSKTTTYGTSSSSSNGVGYFTSDDPNLKSNPYYTGEATVPSGYYPKSNSSYLTPENTGYTYDPNISVNRITGLKGMYDAAEKAGNTEIMAAIRDEAEKSYSELETNGYNDIANQLRGSNFESSKVVMNTMSNYKPKETAPDYSRYLGEDENAFLMSLYPEGSFDNYYGKYGYGANEQYYINSNAEQQKAYEASLALAKQNAEETAKEAARRAYVAYMLGMKNIPQQLAAAGITGGMAESNILKANLAYQNELADIEKSKNDVFSQLDSSGIQYNAQLQSELAEKIAANRSAALAARNNELAKFRDYAYNSLVDAKASKTEQLNQQIALAMQMYDFDKVAELTGLNVDTIKQMTNQQLMQTAQEYALAERQMSLVENQYAQDVKQSQAENAQWASDYALEQEKLKLEQSKNADLLTPYYKLMNGDPLTPAEEAALRAAYGDSEVDKYLLSTQPQMEYNSVAMQNSLNNIVGSINKSSAGGSTERIEYNGNLTYFVPNSKINTVIDQVYNSDIIPNDLKYKVLTERFNISYDAIKAYLNKM